MEEFEMIERTNTRAQMVLKSMVATVKEGQLVPTGTGGFSFQPMMPTPPGLPGMPPTIMPAGELHVFLGDAYKIASFGPDEAAEAHELADALNEALSPVHGKFKKKYLADLKKLTGK